jgi:hypothetical protein
LQDQAAAAAVLMRPRQEQVVMEVSPVAALVAVVPLLTPEHPGPVEQGAVA